MEYVKDYKFTSFEKCKKLKDGSYHFLMEKMSLNSKPSPLVFRWDKETNCFVDGMGGIDEHQFKRFWVYLGEVKPPVFDNLDFYNKALALSLSDWLLDFQSMKNSSAWFKSKSFMTALGCCAHYEVYFRKPFMGGRVNPKGLVVGNFGCYAEDDTNYYVSKDLFFCLKGIAEKLSVKRITFESVESPMLIKILKGYGFVGENPDYEGAPVDFVYELEQKV